MENEVKKPSINDIKNNIKITEGKINFSKVEEIEEAVNNCRKDIKNIKIEELAPWERKEFDDIYSNFKSLQKRLEDYKKIHINVKTKSWFNDIGINFKLLSGIEVESLVAKSWEYEYYKITLNQKKYILRYNPNDNDDEVALLPIIPENIDLLKTIELSEKGREFQDIAIQWGDFVDNLSIWSWIWATTWAAVAWIVKYWPEVIRNVWPKVMWGWAIVAGLTSPWWVPLACTIWWLVAWWVIVWGSIAAFTNPDFTTKDAKENGLSEKLDKAKNYQK